MKSLIDLDNLILSVGAKSPHSDQLWLFLSELCAFFEGECVKTIPWLDKINFHPFRSGTRPDLQTLSAITMFLDEKIADARHWDPNDGSVDFLETLYAGWKRVLRGRLGVSDVTLLVKSWISICAGQRLQRTEHASDLNRHTEDLVFICSSIFLKYFPES